MTRGPVNNPCCCRWPDGTRKIVSRFDCYDQGGVCVPWDQCGPATLGRCCFYGVTPPACQNLTQMGCAEQGGSDWVAGENCRTAPCNQPGACCRGDGVCQQTLAVDCQGENDYFDGAGTLCNEMSCLIRACCLTNGTCLDMYRERCARQFGIPHLGGLCADEICAGACCYADEHCEEKTQQDCLLSGGMFQGLGVACASDPCRHPGACCEAGGICNLRTARECAAVGGVFKGSSITCLPNPCRRACGQLQALAAGHLRSSHVHLVATQCGCTVCGPDTPLGFQVDMENLAPECGTDYGGCRGAAVQPTAESAQVSLPDLLPCHWISESFEVMFQGCTWDPEHNICLGPGVAGPGLDGLSCYVMLYGEGVPIAVCGNSLNFGCWVGDSGRRCHFDDYCNFDVPTHNLHWRIHIRSIHAGDGTLLPGGAPELRGPTGAPWRASGGAQIAVPGGTPASALWQPGQQTAGLGGSIAKLTTATGIKAAVKRLSKLTGRPCGCDGREVSANRMLDYEQHPVAGKILHSLGL